MMSQWHLAFPENCGQYTRLQQLLALTHTHNKRGQLYRRNLYCSNCVWNKRLGFHASRLQFFCKFDQETNFLKLSLSLSAWCVLVLATVGMVDSPKLRWVNEILHSRLSLKKSTTLVRHGQCTAGCWFVYSTNKTRERVPWIRIVLGQTQIAQCTLSAAMPMPDPIHNEIHACPSLVHRTSHWWFLAKAILGHMLGLQNALKLFWRTCPISVSE